MSLLSGAFRFLGGDRSADTAVPPSGATGHLTTVAAAAMALMAVFAIAGTLAAGRVAERWAGAMEGAATLEIPADAEAADEAAERARMILTQTPGIRSVRRIEAEETAALLGPWLGDETLVDALGLPVMLAIEEEPGIDRAGLEMRLAGELPDAIYHTHAAWSANVSAAAERLRWLSLGFLAITLAVTGVVVTLAARASLAVNAKVIATLRLIGAQDSFIARAFVRRFTLRSLGGATAGTVAGLVLLVGLPVGTGGALAGIAPESAAGWLAILLVPVAAGGLAFVATRRAAFLVLRRIR